MNAPPPHASRAGSPWSGRRRSHEPTVVLVDLDPYVRMLIRQAAPKAALVEASAGDDLGRLLGEGPNLVVVDVGNRRVAQALIHRDRTRIVALRGDDEPAEDLDVDAVIARPFLTSELQATVARLLTLDADGRRGRNVSESRGGAGPDLGRWHAWTHWVLPTAAIVWAVAAVAAVASRGAPDVLGGALLLLAGLLAGVHMNARRTHGTARLRHIQQMLKELRHATEPAPDAMNMSSVANRLLDDVATEFEALAGFVSVNGAGMLVDVASFGATPRVVSDPDPQPALAGVHAIAIADLPIDDVPEHLADAMWFRVPIVASSLEGILVIAVSSPIGARGRHKLESRVGKAAVALENARNFGHIRALVEQSQRSRLAAQLQEDVTQTLAHIRLEVERLARFATGEEESHLRAVAGTSGRALHELRRLIGQLNTNASPAGLAAALYGYSRDLEGISGIPFDCYVGSLPPLRPSEEQQIFAVARQVMSVAANCRRSGPITLRLRTVESATTCQVRFEVLAAMKGSCLTHPRLEHVRQTAAAVGARVRSDRGTEEKTCIEVVFEPVLDAHDHHASEPREDLRRSLGGGRG